MSGGFGISPWGGTLAALQQAQLAREKYLKECSITKAIRFIEYFGPEHGWPEDDVKEVLYALGLVQPEK